MNVSEPPMKHRELKMAVKTGALFQFREEYGGSLLIVHTATGVQEA